MKTILNNVVGDRYYVLGILGKGGFSYVYKVKDIHTGAYYALKEYIISDPANEKNLLEGIERELTVLRYVSHKTLPKILNLIKDNGKYFLVMELVSGINLKEYIKQNKRMKMGLLCNVMEQVISGLYYLHSLDKPIVYRDLKPANIILMDDGTVKLVDFGISKRYRDDIDIDRLALGSRGFGAPEQFKNDAISSIMNTDIRTDIYAIGTTLFYLKTGHIYCGKFPLFFNSKLKRIIKKCVMKNPADRYQDCIEVLCEMKTLHNRLK